MQSVRQIAVYHDDVNNKVVLVCPGDVDHRLQGHQHGNHCSQATGSFALNQEYRQPLCIRLTRVDEEQRILSAPPIRVWKPTKGGHHHAPALGHSPSRLPDRSWVVRSTALPPSVFVIVVPSVSVSAV